MRGPKRTVEVLTGEVEPLSLKDLQTRVNLIRSRNKIIPSRYTLDQDQSFHNRTEFASFSRTEELRGEK